MILSTSRERAGQEGRVGTDVRGLRVNSAHGLRGRLSRSSEISMGYWLCRMGATSSLGLGCESCLGLAGLCDLVTGACLRPTVTLGADLAVLPFFLFFVTAFRVGLSVTIVRGWSCSLEDTAPTRCSSQVPDSPARQTAPPFVPLVRR